MKLSKLFGLVMVLVLVVPVFAVFAQDEMMEYELPEIDPAFVEGNIVTAGSSTVFPLSQAMVERFSDAGYGGSITIDSIGSGAGFERFCAAGETDISNASSPIKQEQIDQCAEIGRTPIEFRVGTDALAVSVSVENDFIGEEGLTIEQLGLIFSGTTATWDAVNPEYPAEPILLYSPGSDSGTFAYFVEEVMEAYAEAQGVAEEEIGDAAEAALLDASGIQLSEDDNVLVQGVASSPYAIGYFGFAYYLENADVIKPVAIEGVAPNEDAVNAGEYPLARPLFIYSDAGVMMEKPQVMQFIGYYLSNVNEIIGEVGYFPAAPEVLNEAKGKWLAVACEAGMEGVDEETCTMVAEMMAE